MNTSHTLPVVLALSLSLGGCGIFVPEKTLFGNDNVDPPKASASGMYEHNIVAHIRCEIRNGVWRALQRPDVGWLQDYGAKVTFKITVDEQGSLAPNLSLLPPFFNSEVFTLGIGLSGSAQATRVETVQLPHLEIAELLAEQRKNVKRGTDRVRQLTARDHDRKQPENWSVHLRQGGCCGRRRTSASTKSAERRHSPNSRTS